MLLTNSQTYSGNTYGGQWDHLPLPGDITIGKTDTDTLRRIFHRMGIPQSHTLARELLCQRYAKLLSEIGNEARDRAIMAWLEQFKD
jgi:hypothetical protein